MNRRHGSIFISPEIEANIKRKKKEVEALLKELCINTDNVKLKKLFKTADRDGDNQLDKEELENLINMIYHRDDIVKVFKTLTRSTAVMSLEEFGRFLAEVQKEPKSEAEVLQIIRENEYQEDLKELKQISAYGFMNYLLTEDNHLRNPDHSKVYQDMSQPVCNYYINCSHNTYVLSACMHAGGGFDGTLLWISFWFGSEVWRDRYLWECSVIFQKKIDAF